MKRLLNLFTLVAFCFSNLSSSLVFAQTIQLPTPGTMVSLSAKGDFPLLKGLRLNPDNPLKMDFIIEPNGAPTVTKEDAALLARYFLAALAMPKQDTWVNLSPYESQRIVPDAMADTDLGKDLLGQDYILKQLASSLTYPESETGKAYWQSIQGAGSSKTSATNNFNKVWIIPNKSSVYENGNTVLISESTLAVKTEEDYLAMQNNNSLRNLTSATPTANAFKQTILPLIEKDVNTGKNFAQLRQIYSALILAEWFKNKFFDSFYHNYINQAKTKGITIDEKGAKDKIYALYLEAFKKGAYNYTKKVETQFIASKKITKRQYFSGGASAATLQVTPGPVTQASGAAVVALGQVETGVSEKAAALSVVLAATGLMVPQDLVGSELVKGKNRYRIDPQALLNDPVFNDYAVTVIENSAIQETGKTSDLAFDQETKQINIVISPALDDLGKAQRIFYELCELQAKRDPANWDKALTAAAVMYRQQFPEGVPLRSDSSRLFMLALSDQYIAQFREIFLHGSTSALRDYPTLASTHHQYMKFYHESIGDIAAAYAKEKYSAKFNELPKVEPSMADVMMDAAIDDFVANRRAPRGPVSAKKPSANSGDHSLRYQAEMDEVIRTAPKTALKISAKGKASLDIPEEKLNVGERIRPQIRQLLSGGSVAKLTFQYKFTYGDKIFDWLMQNGYFKERTGDIGHPVGITNDLESALARLYPKQKEEILAILRKAQLSPGHLCPIPRAWQDPDNRKGEFLNPIDIIADANIVWVKSDKIDDGHFGLQRNVIYIICPYLNRLSDGQLVRRVTHEAVELGLRRWAESHNIAWNDAEAFRAHRIAQNYIQSLEELAYAGTGLNDNKLADMDLASILMLTGYERQIVKERLQHILLNFDHRESLFDVSDEQQAVWKTILEKLEFLANLKSMGIDVFEFVPEQDTEARFSEKHITPGEAISLLTALSWIDDDGRALRAFIARSPESILMRYKIVPTIGWLALRTYKPQIDNAARLAKAVGQLPLKALSPLSQMPLGDQGRPTRLMLEVLNRVSPADLDTWLWWRGFDPGWEGVNLDKSKLLRALWWGHAERPRYHNFEDQSNYARDLALSLQTLQTLKKATRFGNGLGHFNLNKRDIFAALGDLTQINAADPIHTNLEPEEGSKTVRYATHVYDRFARAALVFELLYNLEPAQRENLLKDEEVKKQLENAKVYFQGAFDKGINKGNEVLGAMIETLLGYDLHGIVKMFDMHFTSPVKFDDLVPSDAVDGKPGSPVSGDISPEHRDYLDKLRAKAEKVVQLYPQDSTLPRSNTAFQFRNIVTATAFGNMRSAPAKIGSGTEDIVSLGEILRDLKIKFYQVKGVDEVRYDARTNTIEFFCENMDKRSFDRSMADVSHEVVEAAVIRRQGAEHGVAYQAWLGHSMAVNYVQAIEELAYAEFSSWKGGDLSDARIAANMTIGNILKTTGRKREVIAARIRYILLNYAHHESYYPVDSYTRKIWQGILEKFNSLEEFKALGIDLTEIYPEDNLEKRASPQQITIGEAVSLLVALAQASGEGNNLVKEFMAANKHISAFPMQDVVRWLRERGDKSNADVLEKKIKDKPLPVRQRIAPDWQKGSFSGKYWHLQVSGGRPVFDVISDKKTHYTVLQMLPSDIPPVFLGQIALSAAGMHITYCPDVGGKAFRALITPMLNDLAHYLPQGLSSERIEMIRQVLTKFRMVQAKSSQVKGVYADWNQAIIYLVRDSVDPNESEEIFQQLAQAAVAMLDFYENESKVVSAAKKPTTQSALVDSETIERLSSTRPEDGYIGEIKGEGREGKYVIHIFKDEAMPDHDAILVGKQDIRMVARGVSVGTPVIAMRQSVAAKEEGVPYLVNHEIGEDRKVAERKKYWERTWQRQLTVNELRQIVDNEHPVFAARERLEWIADKGMRLLPRDLDALSDKSNAGVLIDQWNQGWLDKHKPFWQAAGLTGEDIATLEVYARLFNETAVGGEDFRGMKTKSSGNFAKMELKGTNLQDLSDLNVEITAIVPFRP